MTKIELTHVYLGRDEKKALEQRAKENGTKVGEEVCRAVDFYLGISPDVLRLLDEGTRKAEHRLKEMVQELDRVNAALDAAVTKLSRKQARHGRQHERYH